jgi:hypothetical protein
MCGARCTRDARAGRYVGGRREVRGARAPGGTWGPRAGRYVGPARREVRGARAPGACRLRVSAHRLFSWAPLSGLEHKGVGQRLARRPSGPKRRRARAVADTTYNPPRQHPQQRGRSSPDRGAEMIAGGRWRGRDKPPARGPHVHPAAPGVRRPACRHARSQHDARPERRRRVAAQPAGGAPDGAPSLRHRTNSASPSRHPASAQASQSPSRATISSVARAQVQCAIGSGHPRQVHVTGVRGPLQYGQGDGVGAANIGPTIPHRAPRRHPP